MRTGASARDWGEPQAAVVVEAMCNHGIVVTDSSAHVKLAIERSGSGAGSKWRREAQEQLDTLSLHDFELVDVSGMAAVDTRALWEVARNWAVDRYGDGSTPASGWYQGSFWATVNTCVGRAVHRPDWFAVR